MGGEGEFGCEGGELNRGSGRTQARRDAHVFDQHTDATVIRRYSRASRSER